MQVWESAKNALKCVLEAVSGERIVIVCDDEKAEVGKAFSEGALALGLWTRLLALETGRETRKEVPAHLLEILSSQKPDLYVNLLRGVGDETPFRIKLIHLETRAKRSRLGHCPGVNIDMLSNGALALTVEEHGHMQDFARSLIRMLKGTVGIEVESPSGTDLVFKTENRDFFTDTVIDWKELKWMNLPTGEVIVAPLEDSLEGTLVCDMAIGGIGSVSTTIKLQVKQGVVVEVSSDDETTLSRVRNMLAIDDWAKVVGEFAFGINPKARFVDEFLESEKIVGTTHFAFGSNTDMPGGKNLSSSHMDLLISKPTVKAIKKGGEETTVLADGKFQI
ncbi:MAG: aminopeptidase [Candidatus Bathyarchaeota archaeon]|nr:aminopeptidase [Candidatus Bathyarchaeota archaeon]